MTTEYGELEEKKNYFFRDSYRKLLNLAVLLLWLGVVLSATLVFLTWSPTTPKYFASTTSGEIYQLHPLSEPVVTDKFVMKWASLLATQVYNLNFENYNSQLDALKPKFTENGWAALQSAMGPFINSLTAKKLISSAVVSAAPVISLRAVIHHRFTWVVEFPLLLSYQSASETKKQNLIAQIRVMRVPVLDDTDGIQCEGFVVSSPL